ncbi:hypothetical protein IFM89_032906 [Coptis chinensis]|uniref:Reverse transcriptase zinc-binding domain-containing protein n=1 Tax=Coptis chinensis TaxID=261450 RepID=A0A835IRF1_9MAGN|nr:hypothetical protein IFM89_032906 [Coptis chinensis]
MTQLRNIHLRNDRYQIRVRIQDHTNRSTVTIFGKEVETLVKHPASELEAMLRSASSYQMVKNILNELIGSSLIFEIRISEYIIKDHGTNGFTTTKVFHVDYKLEGEMMLTHIDQMQATMEIHTLNTIYPYPISEHPKIEPVVDHACVCFVIEVCVCVVFGGTWIVSEEELRCNLWGERCLRNAWDITRLGELFPNLISDCIKTLTIKPNVIDKIIWWKDKKGVLTVKSTYKLLAKEYEEGERSRMNKKSIRRIWKIKIDAATQLFTWKAYMGGLPTGAVLIQKKFKGDVSCVFCERHVEADYHLFFGYEWSRTLWYGSNISLRVDAKKEKDIRCWLDDFIRWERDKDLHASSTYGLCMMHEIWKARNKLKFERKRSSFQELYTIVNQTVRRFT